MRSPLKKIGVLFAVAAVFLTTALLPLHHHEEETASKTDCAVCHVTESFRTGSPAASFAGLTFFENTFSLVQINVSPFFSPLQQSFSSRAPPVA